MGPTIDSTQEVLQMGTTKTTYTQARSNGPDRTAKAATANEEERPTPKRVGKVGNVTRDPVLELGKDSGKPYCRFGIAVDSAIDGDWSNKKTEFFEVTAFGSLAENVCTTIAKGTRVVVVGRGEVECWVDDDGNARETRRILADGVGVDLRFDTVIISPRHATSQVTEFGDDEPF
jgi:single stranded DNA-binding protein